MIFQTMILNSQFADITINNNFRYYRYKKNSSNVAILNEEDYEKIKISKYLFCRKVNDISEMDKYFSEQPSDNKEV